MNHWMNEAPFFHFVGPVRKTGPTNSPVFKYKLMTVVMSLQVLDLLEDACESLLDTILAENNHVSDS